MGARASCLSSVFGQPRRVRDQDRWLEYKVSGEWEDSTGRLGSCDWREMECNGDSNTGLAGERDW